MIGILFDIVIFYIIYSAMDKDVEYLKCVLIYVLGMEIELFIVMLLSGHISISIMFILFGTYFAVGLLVIFIMNKLNNRYLFEKIPFIIVGVVVNIAVNYVATKILGVLISIGIV